MASESGLFGVRGFGLYERWNSWTNNAAEAEEESPQRVPDFPAGFGAFSASSGAVEVLARCRPVLRSGDASCTLSADVAPEGARLRFQAQEVGLHEICCTAYLGPDSSQETVFEHAAHIVERTVDGCNGLVLCCGTSGSGKTYTMAGPLESNLQPGSCESFPSEGIIPRAARLIFERIQKMEEVFVVEASFLDICPSEGGRQEQLTDLLSEKPPGRLRVLQDALRPGVFTCEGLSRVPVRRHEKVSELLKAGLKRREVLEAGQRRRPRNAHCLLTISLESLGVAEDVGEPVVKRGKLVFVEFAGLPSPGLAYGSAGPSAQRSPALEMLLTDCVSGESPVLLVANFSPELKCAEQSVRTLALAESVLLGREMQDEHAAEHFLHPPEGPGGEAPGWEEEAEPPPAASLPPEREQPRHMPQRSAAPTLTQRQPAAAAAAPAPASASWTQQPSAATNEASAARRPAAPRLARREAPAPSPQAWAAPEAAEPQPLDPALSPPAWAAPMQQQQPSPPAWADPSAQFQEEAPLQRTPPRHQRDQRMPPPQSSAPQMQEAPPQRTPHRQPQGHRMPPPQSPAPQMQEVPAQHTRSLQSQNQRMPSFQPPAPQMQAAAPSSYGYGAELKMRSGAGAARIAELEDQLRESHAMRRAVEMEVTQVKAKVASTEERVRLLAEHSEELSRDRNSHNEEHRTLRTKADMQQQKLIMHEEELQKLRSEVVEKKAQVASISASLEADMAAQTQERESWRKAEVELQQKVSKLRKELEDFRRKSGIERLRSEKASDEACMELRMRIQQLQEKAVVDAGRLESAQQLQASMTTEKRVQEQREEALKETGMRELLKTRQELEEARHREGELQHMLTELQDGLLSAEEAAAQEGGGYPTPVAGR